MVPNDLKHAFRMLARSPGYTLAAVAALTLGIGANTAIFSVINTVLLKPLTYPDPDRIVQLMNTSPNGTYAWASIPNFSNWRDQTSVLDAVAAFDQGGSAMNITGAYPEQVRAARVTADYFRLFGARFVHGRGFTPDEDRPHAGRNVVLSYALWQRRFAADPGILGKTVDLSGEPYVIIGVTAQDYRTDPVVDAWVPFQLDMNSADQGHYFFVAGRLKPGVTLECANAQLQPAKSARVRQFRTHLPATPIRASGCRLHEPAPRPPTRGALRSWPGRYPARQWQSEPVYCKSAPRRSPKRSQPR